MARMKPYADPDQIANDGERQVAKALLASLDDSFLIYHNYPLLEYSPRPNGRGEYLRQGEIDFLIIVPDLGILVLEVKGGDIGYLPDEGWVRRKPYGNERITNPAEQARKGIWAVVQRVGEEHYGGPNGFPGAHGYAVVLPTHGYTGTAPPGLQHKNLLTPADLSFLDRRIVEILKAFTPTPRSFSTDDAKKVQATLDSTFQLRELLVQVIIEGEERLVQLTEQQKRVIAGLAENDRALISGTAGSGKTVLAMTAAKRFAAAGKKTLFLCFNKQLAQWLRSQVSEPYRGSIVVEHFHGLCRRLCGDAGVPFTKPMGDAQSDQDFWNHTAAGLLDAAIDRIDERYDAIVVDEAQDFCPEWWLPIESLNRRGEAGALYLFFDRAQNIYRQTEPEFPSVQARYQLPINCRNTREIAKTCGTVLGVDIEVDPFAGNGESPKFQFAASAEERARVCDQQIRNWVGGNPASLLGQQRKHWNAAGKLAPSQIAVLCPWRKDNSSLRNHTQLGGVPIVEDLTAWHEERGLLFSTTHSFKGLEADAIVLLDVPNPLAGHFDAVDLYVACSRAKHRLSVIAADPRASAVLKGSG